MLNVWGATGVFIRPITDVVLHCTLI